MSRRDERAALCGPTRQSADLLEEAGFRKAAEYLKSVHPLVKLIEAV